MAAYFPTTLTYHRTAAKGSDRGKVNRVVPRVIDTGKANEYEKKKKQVTNTPVLPHTRSPATRIPTRAPELVDSNCNLRNNSQQLKFLTRRRKRHDPKKQTNRQNKCCTTDNELHNLIRAPTPRHAAPTCPHPHAPARPRTPPEENQLRVEKSRPTDRTNVAQQTINCTTSFVAQHASGATGPSPHVATKQKKAFVRNFWTDCFM